MSPLPRSYPELQRYPALRSLGPQEPPPLDLVPETYSARLYEMLGPLAQWDPQAAWSLLILVNAIGSGLGFQLVEDLVRDTPEGPGWSALLDVERCPEIALPWLAQLVGVRLPPGLSEADQRARIRSTDGFRRGTRAAMIGAARATLTGGRTVLFRERDGAGHGYPASPDYAYVLTVHTYTSETPNPTATLNALLAQKPGGILMFYTAIDGQDWQQLRDNWANWGAVKTGYSDWLDVKTDQPT